MNAQPEHLAKSSLYVLILMAILGFAQYAIINWNTQQPWYPFVVGPLMAISMLLGLAVVVFAGDYQLGILTLISFISTTLAIYSLTYDHSTVLDYEYMAVLISIMLIILIYLDRVEGSIDMGSINLVLMLALIYLPYLVYVLLAFKYGSYYNYVTMVIALFDALVNLLIFVPIFTERLIQTVIVTSIALTVFLIYVAAAGVLGPDVTEWMIRATLLSSYLAPVWTAVRSGWE